MNFVEGCYHDAASLKTTELYNTFENMGVRPIPNGYIIGDSAYPLLDWLIPSYVRPRTPAERGYNLKHNRTRVTVERTYGELKSVFRRLRTTLDMKDTGSISTLITACAILHNYRKSVRVPTFRERVSIATFNPNMRLSQVQIPNPNNNLTPTQLSRFRGEQRRLSLH